MPDKVIDIPNVGQIAFPEGMSDADVNAAATKLYQGANAGAKQPPVKSWVDTAVDWIPTVGGIAGGITGGIVGAGPVGAVGGAAMGGLVGERLKEYAQSARGTAPLPSQMDAVKRMAGQAALQGGAEVAGGVLGKVMEHAAPALMNSAVKMTGKGAVKAAISGDVHPVVKTLLDEGINVSPGGMEKLNTVLMATNDEIKSAIKSVTADVNPFKVASKLQGTAKTFAEQVDPGKDLEAISGVGQRFLENNPSLTVQQAQAMKTGTYRQIANKYGELGSAEVEAQKSLARGLKDEIANEVGNTLLGIKGKLGLSGGVDISALNAREGALLEAQTALAKRLAVSGRQNPMGLASLAVTHPVTFLTVLMDRSPAVKSMLARGLYNSAAAAGGVSPQLLKAAVTAIATSSDTPRSSTE